MNFKKYNSIENTYQNNFIFEIRKHGFEHEEYVVQEKIHGANFSFICDGKHVKCAKRTDIISSNEEFFNYQYLLKNIENQLFELFHSISKSHEVKEMVVFGELFGGGYPHAEVPVQKEFKIIQKGIYYSPKVEFIGFDIFINNTEYLDLDICNSLLEMHGINYARTLFRGSLNDCLKHSNEFKTTIPSQLLLPDIDGNTCEGVVIRPVHTLFLNSGARVILKNKNEKWAENNSKIDKSTLSQIIQQEQISLSEEAEFLKIELLQLVNENRLQNVISKIGTVDASKDFGKLVGMLNKDILEEFNKSHQLAYQSLEKTETKALNKVLNTYVSKLIVSYFNQI